MSTKTTKPRPASSFADPEEMSTDAEFERVLNARHAEIEGKLKTARASIARGEAAPLEPLEALLRDARRRAKAPR